MLAEGRISASFVANVGDNQGLVSICINDKVTIKVGNCTGTLDAFNLHGGSDNGFTQVIQHDTLKGVFQVSADVDINNAVASNRLFVFIFDY